ncbi:MAG: hypothetical protein QXJ65_02225 [Acidilobaceae archaeon]
MSKELDRIIDELVRDAESIMLSDNPSEEFIIIEKKRGNYIFIAPASGDNVSIVEINSRRLIKAETTLQETIGEYVESNGILTLACGPRDKHDDFYAHSWDVNRRGLRVFYGYSKAHYILLIARIYWCLDLWDHVSMILWSFTDRVDSKSGLPIKQLRGFILSRDNRLFNLHKVSIEELIEAHNTDYKTGKWLEPEPAVEYCYDYNCVPSESLG